MTTVGEALSLVPVRRVVHFTPAVNLDGIFRDQTVRPSDDLGGDGQPHHTATDTLRLDGQRGHVCCSFEYPNAYYQDRAASKAEFVNYPSWVCLILDRDVVLREGTLFYPCNAAKSGGGYGDVGGDAMLQMWAEPSVPGGYRRRPSHYPGVPTDLQAEIQIPGAIPLSAVQAIVVPTPERARELFGHLRAYGLHPERVEWRSAPLFFRKHDLASAIHRGSQISEVVWTPSAEDLA